MKKVFSYIFSFLLIVSCIFAFTSCSKDSQKLELRVSENNIQWSTDGVNWEDIISISELKGSQGIQGVQGEPGKSIEFQTTETHIQWRYVGDKDWTNLISFDELREKEEEIDVGALKTRAFNLFTSKLLEMNRNYTITYDYSDKYIVESFIKKYGVNDTNQIGNKIWFNASIEYDYSATTSFPEKDIEKFHPYCLNLMPYINGDWKPTNYILANYKYDAELNNYVYQFGGGTVNYPTIADDITDYNFVSFLKGFKLENIIDCTFNDNGDCRIKFNFYSNSYSSSRPYQSKDYIYEFNVTNSGEIRNCYVYEKDFLNSTQIGDLYCKISYEKDKTLITEDMFNEVLEAIKEEKSEITNWFDAFGYNQED